MAGCVDRVAELDASILEKESDVASLKARMELMQDDLTIISGIGPKVSFVLRSARIDTFRKLASTSVKKIREVLEAENPNLLRLIDPLDWPDQARLAAEGNPGALTEKYSAIYPNGGRSRNYGYFPGDQRPFA